LTCASTHAIVRRGAGRAGHAWRACRAAARAAASHMRACRPTPGLWAEQGCRIPPERVLVRKSKRTLSFFTVRGPRSTKAMADSVDVGAAPRVDFARQGLGAGQRMVSESGSPDCALAACRVTVREDAIGPTARFRTNDLSVSIAASTVSRRRPARRSEGSRPDRLGRGRCGHVVIH
jgi:hypothetical protein